MVAGPSAAATPDAKAALRKLVQALPETFRAEAEAAAAAVMLDPAKWGMTTAPRPAHLDELQQAVVDGVQVRLGYSDRTRAQTERVVHPLGLVEKGAVWYLIGDTDNGLRTFRVGRVRSVERTKDPVVRPDGFDLAEAWQDVVTTIEERRTSVRTTRPGSTMGGGRAARPVRHTPSPSWETTATWPRWRSGRRPRKWWRSSSPDGGTRST